MVKNKKIVVFFIKLHTSKLNTASENRFRAIYEMTSSNFQTEIYHTKEIRRNIKKPKFIRGAINRLKIIETSFEIGKKKNKDDTNILYLFGVDPLLSLYYFVFGKCFNILLVNERNEFPTSIIRGTKVIETIEKIVLYPWYYKIFNGYSLISNELIKHYSPYLSTRQIITKLPMTVDFSRFNYLTPEISKKYIFFAGSLNNKKDGIEYLLKAFIAIQESLKDVILLIASASTDSEYHHIEKIIQQNNCNNIKLLGAVSREKIPQYLISSSVCVLPRPDNPQTRAGFPTKLGEYLASGRPVIVSDVGEIRDYLDQTEVYYISPDNLESDLKDRLLEVFGDYASATQKGLLGKKKASKVFSLESNRLIVKKFVNDVAKKHNN